MTKLKVILLTIAISIGLVVPASDASPATDGLSRLYCAYFDRAPDPGGRVYWESMIARGMVLDQVADVFADSPEYRLLYGNTSNTIFVARMYTNIMGRDLDVGGHAYWLGLLDAGLVNRGELMVQFSESNEYQTVVYPKKTKCDGPLPLTPSPTTPTTQPPPTTTPTTTATAPTGNLNVKSLSSTGAVISANLSECASVSWSISPGGVSASSGTCDNPHLMNTSRAGTLTPNTTYAFTANFTTAKDVRFQRTISFTTAAQPPPVPDGTETLAELLDLVVELNLIGYKAEGAPLVEADYNPAGLALWFAAVERDSFNGYIYSPYDDRWMRCSLEWCDDTPIDLRVSMDHIVSLQEANDAGGWRWSAQAKKAFGNDLANVRVMSTQSAIARNGQGPPDWMPPNNSSSVRCEFFWTWTFVKVKYRLTLHPAEHSWLEFYDVNFECSQ